MFIIQGIQEINVKVVSLDICANLLINKVNNSTKNS